jgi:hypothetical protein
MVGDPRSTTSRQALADSGRKGADILSISPDLIQLTNAERSIRVSMPCQINVASVQVSLILKLLSPRSYLAN